MGACAAPFCNNAGYKGYIMKRFPRDPVRRTVWAQNVPRDNWTPTNNSCLCEVHFAPDMWEPGHKHKLKKDAIPTIFGFFLKKQVPSKDIETDGSIKSNADKITNVNDTSEPTIGDVEHEAEMETVMIRDTSERTTDDVEHEAEMETDITHDTNEPASSVNMSSGSKIIQSDKEETEKYQKLVKKLRLRLITMSRKMKALQSTNKNLKSEITSIIKNEKYKKALSSLFNEDQITSLCTKKRTRDWSNVTLQRALKLKFACGTNGYEELLRQGIPFPSLRTLRQKLENCKFEPGISKQMLQFLKFKQSSNTKEIDIECGLIFDEMSITQKKCYNPATGSLVGNITFPGETGIATHAIVFMLVGIGTRWKHVIIHDTGELGFHVNFITSDMGAGNTGLWKLLNISTGRFSQIKNYITHPFDSTRKLFVIADPPHTFKNLKQALVNNETITISDDIVRKYKLLSDKIELRHFNELLNIQENSDLLLTPALKADDIKCNTYSKMNKAKHVFSYDSMARLLRFKYEREWPQIAGPIKNWRSYGQTLIIGSLNSCKAAFLLNAAN